DWSKENEEHRECESGTSKERKRKFEPEEENNQTWRVGKDTRAHNSGTVKINRICKGKNKEIIAESSKKVLSKEDWSMEKDLIHKKNGSSLVDQIKANEIWGIIEKAIIEAANKSLLKKKMRFIRDRLGLPIEETDKLEFNLTIEKINTNLQLEIRQAKNIWTEDTLVEKPDRYINFCNLEIREESTNSIMRFLDIWLNTKMKETLIKTKAKRIVRAMVISLYPKKLIWGQLAYLNNVCIIPKLIYMLQATRLSEYELQEIHRPLLKLIKNKAELQVTTSTSLLKYKGLGNCRALANKLFQKQVISLYKRLNSTGTEALATELRLRQGFNNTRIVNVMSDLGKIDNIKKIWKFNLACLVLLKAEKLKFHFNFSSKLWQIEQGEIPL
ncbi:33544_t:CDS:2, partial [Gigaspora margarita]